MKLSTTPDIPHVSVILLSYNQKDYTLACLTSFQSVTYKNITIFLVDNASTDGTFEAVRKKFPSVNITRSEFNLGCAGGRNLGAKLAVDKHNSGYLLIIDNDTVVDPDFISHLVDFARTTDKCGIVTAKILDYNQKDVIDSCGLRVNLYTGNTDKVGFREKDIGQYDHLVQVKAASGCCQLIPVALWKQLNGYDSSFSPYGYEDTDMSLRVREIGKTILFSHKAKIYHKSTQTLGDGKYVSTYTKVKGKHMRRFLAKHARLHHKVVFFCVAPFLAIRPFYRAIRSGDPYAALHMFSSFIFQHQKNKCSKIKK